MQGASTITKSKVPRIIIPQISDPYDFTQPARFRPQLLDTFITLVCSNRLNVNQLRNALIRKLSWQRSRKGRVQIFAALFEIFHYFKDEYLIRLKTWEEDKDTFLARVARGDSVDVEGIRDEEWDLMKEFDEVREDWGRLVELRRAMREVEPQGLGGMGWELLAKGVGVMVDGKRCGRWETVDGWVQGLIERNREYWGSGFPRKSDKPRGRKWKLLCRK